MTAICVLASANIVSAAPFAYVANSGTKNVSVIDTADDTIKATIALPDTQTTVHPYAFGIAVGASGQNIYVGLQDTNEVAVLDAVTKLPIKRIGLGVDSPGGLAVNDAETRLYVASNLSNTLVVIDISGTGAAEVGRITIDDAPISNPTGVVLNAAGDKAYVASSTTGNIAEVSLDETNNVYDRTATIALGGVQPAGLSLSPDGSMLYVASLNGNVRAIKLSDKSVTNLTTADGTLALAVKPDGSKVYAPSNSTDKLYVIDSSVTPNTVLGTTYPVVAGPYGISITPDGSKLYMTMNTSTAGETVSVFDTTSNTVTSTIALPALAKPTSFGNFIGPRLQYTINATNGANCSISPLGLIPVNDKGRVFNISATSGACEVKVDGVSVGQPSAYSFTGITSGTHTIDASQAAGATYYTLTVDWNPQVGSRCLSSTPAGISCYSKSAKFAAGTTVDIKAIAGFAASNWTGACAGSGPTCTLTMDADKTAAADLNHSIGGPVKNHTKGTYHATIDDAIANATNGDEIRIVAAYTPTSVTTSGSATTIVKLSGGWNSDQTAQIGTSSVGTVTIVGAGIIADNLVI
jgi:DNA-binding beta-propeller fold protein YncE